MHAAPSCGPPSTRIRRRMPPMTASALARFVGGLQAIADRAISRPLEHRRWLPGQLALATCVAKRKLLRAGNQAQGKTEIGAAETWWRLSKTHPFRPDLNRDRIVKGVVLSPTWEQSSVAQERIWDLCDKSLLAPGCVYDSKKGAFLGKYPKVRLRDGSEVVFKSGRGDTLSLAGLTADFGWVDEPPNSPRVYGELQKRVMKRNGDIFLTFTPVNAPVDWLRELAKRGAIEDLHYRMEPRYLIPHGATTPIRLTDGTLMDQAWIDSLILDTLPHEVPVVCHGEWEMVAADPIFRAFRTSGEDSHITRARPTCEIDLYLGMDFGIRKHSTAALLIAVDAHPMLASPRIWIIDEYVSEGETHDDDDAVAVLAMLERNGFVWSDLKGAYADRPHYGSNRKGAIAQKSIGRMSRALEKVRKGKGARAHGIRPGNMSPKLYSAKKKSSLNAPGAVSHGCTFLHKLMIRSGHFHIDPRCTRTVKSLARYKMASNSEWSHCIDALRYGLRDVAYQRRRSSRSPVGVRWG
ncbi:MAG: hypothetical protein GY913_19185 [Proteobacteria bacterium]|nr:hypothetical protein [Pseudomonadota bacterium]